MLPTIGSPSALGAANAAKTAAATAKAEAKPLSPVVLFSLMVFISLGAAFVMVRWRAEGEIGFIKGEWKKMKEDINIIKKAPAPVAGGASVEALNALTAKVTALETLVATSSSNIAVNASTTAAIQALEARQAQLANTIADLSNRPATIVNQVAGTTSGTDASGTATNPAPVAPRNLNIDLCGSEPKTLASGKIQLPVDSKYAGLDVLGQIFTAHNCGGTRVNSVTGVSGAYYTLGLGINLTYAPLGDFLLLLQEKGFKCAETGRDANCKKWKVDRLIELADIYELEPYADEIDSDTCLHCN